jgi:beta-glucosidase
MRIAGKTGAIVTATCTPSSFSLEPLAEAPTVNIVRVPQWGRAFESLGEDPDLAGTIGAAEVCGIQRTGTMAQVKHYAVYTQETNRMSAQDDSIVGAQALQEIYLQPWDDVMAAAPSSVMCSYASVNGTDACQDKDLIDRHLDTTLRFAGFVGSDYFATLRPFTDGATESAHADAASAADARVADQVAEEGTVLLKNADHVLPLGAGGPGNAGGQRNADEQVSASGRAGIAVVGPAAQAVPVTSGGGSATVDGTDVVTPLAGIRPAVHSTTSGRSAPPVTYAAGLPGPADFSAIPAADLGAPSPTPGNAAIEAATLTADATVVVLWTTARPMARRPSTD